MEVTPFSRSMVRMSGRALFATVLLMLLLFPAVQIGPVGGSPDGVDGILHVIDGAGPPSRAPIEWSPFAKGNFTFALDGEENFSCSLDPNTGNFDSGPTYDPYLAHNATVRRAIDRAPQWLNLTLSWKFHEINSYYYIRYVKLLTNTTTDSRYIDELAFTIAYLPSMYLNSWWTLESLLFQNVEMMYKVSSEVSYAKIKDYKRSDGQHSTVVYSTPTGNVTLPEEVYYWYLVLPRNELESPAYINLTNFRKTIDPSGMFWRSFLYTANDTGFPVLRDLLLEQTTLWNGTKNQVENNGAVGAVTFWESTCMSFFYDPNMRRDHQPVSLYKQHYGLCGENAEVLVAAAKTALIPASVVITFEGMHAWNEFYERGWHQWQGYSRSIDDPMAEGAPGGVTVFTGLNPDASQYSATPVYTFTTNLTVRVTDTNGEPVDGAMVKITAMPGTNDPNILPILGNLTDPKGETQMVVGSGHSYYIQVLTSIGNLGESTDPLLQAFPATIPGATHTFNATLNHSLPLKVNRTALEDPPSYGLRFNVTANSIEQRTSAWIDPMGYWIDFARSYLDRTRLVLYFVDDENLSLYSSGSEFWPRAVLALYDGENGSVILPDDRVWHIVSTGLSSPMTQTKAALTVEVSRSIVHPQARIVSPRAGTYFVGEPVEFIGVLEPCPSYIGPLDYLWIIDDGLDNVTTIQGKASFNITMERSGEYNIWFSVWNASGSISSDGVKITLRYHNKPPNAVISSPYEGQVFGYGERVHFIGTESADSEGLDLASCEWVDEGSKEVLSSETSFFWTFTPGVHQISLNVTDREGLYDKAWVNFTILPQNFPPVPYIMFPLPWSTHYDDEPIRLSANGTFDVDNDTIAYSWSSSLDGTLSDKANDEVYLSKGHHEIMLIASDGKDSASASVQINVLERPVPPDLIPIANISSPADGSMFYVNDVVEFSSLGSYDPEGMELNFTWSIDGSNTSHAPSFRATLREGVVTVKLEVTDGRNFASASVTLIVVDRAPILVLKVNGTEGPPQGEIVAFENDTMVFDARASYDPDGTPLTFNWSHGGSMLHDGPVWERTFDPGFYELKLTVTDSGGNMASEVIMLRVLSHGGSGDDDGIPGNDREGFDPLLLIPIAIIVVCAFLLVLFFLLSRKAKKDEVIFEE